MGNPHKQGRGVRFRRAQVGLGNRRKTGARPHQSSQEEQVTDKDNKQVSEDVAVETTSVFRTEFLNELDAPAQTDTESAVSGVEGLPHGSALLVVKRGPNAGSRFLLDQAVTSAGRHPDSDIFLDDGTASRRPPAVRLGNG